MVQRTIVFDDLDGETTGAATVPFGLDGKAYEIDLGDVNAKRLRDLLAEFIEAARQVGTVQVVESKKTRRPKLSRPSAPAPSPTATNGGTPSRTQNQAIREWAKRMGVAIGDKGRIPAHIVERYEAEAGDAAPESVAESLPTPRKPKARKAATKGTRGRKSAAPPAQDVIAVFNQAGHDMGATAEHFKVSVSTAKRWVLNAQETMDPAT